MIYCPRPASFLPPPVHLDLFRPPCSDPPASRGEGPGAGGDGRLVPLGL